MQLIKVPYSKGALGKAEGAEMAPDAILKELKQTTLSESGNLPVFTVNKVEVNPSNVEETHKAILEIAQKIQTPWIGLGGDHSITYSLFKGFAAQHNNAGMLVFDAHPDCMQPFSIATHENYLRQLIEDGILAAENVLVIGLRSWDKEEFTYLKSKKIKYFDMRAIAREGKQAMCDAAMSIVKDFPALYVSIDIDVVDPGMAPGTGYPEPGGITSRELLFFINRLKNLKNIRAGDIVEVCPPKDVNGITIKLAAKLLMEIAAKHL